jgi:phage gp46-like protein
MSAQWEMDPTRKDYVMQLGAPKETSSLKMPAYFRLAVKRGTWMYGPATFGSDFHLDQKRRSSQDASGLESKASRALEPLIDDGRASEIDISTSEAARHGVRLQISIRDAQGAPDNLEFDPIGR